MLHVMPNQATEIIFWVTLNSMYSFYINWEVSLSTGCVFHPFNLYNFFNLSLTSPKACLMSILTLAETI
jgi:hypothetical protein